GESNFILPPKSQLTKPLRPVQPLFTSQLPRSDFLEAPLAAPFGFLYDNFPEGYPFLTAVPRDTSFSCEGRFSGMYADVDYGCQVYHWCVNRRHFTFVCGIGTTFNEQDLVCDHYQHNTCQRSPQEYIDISNINVELEYGDY
ncbi:unnamed protein product, partial [Meganyctiphanes norvegica]